MMNTKQVIVMRKDLNMRKGKMCAQAAHACMAFLTKGYGEFGQRLSEEQRNWMDNSFRKICVYVNSEEELLQISTRASLKNLTCHIVIDNGTTEFGGRHTTTCLAIGPHYDDVFVGVTDHLPLL